MTRTRMIVFALIRLVGSKRRRHRRGSRRCRCSSAVVRPAPARRSHVVGRDRTQRREVARLDAHIFRQGAFAAPVGKAEHSPPYRQSRRAPAESGDHAGEFVTGDRRRSVTVAAVGPGRGPRQLNRDESRRMNNDDVVYRCLRLGSVAPPASSRPFPQA